MKLFTLSFALVLMLTACRKTETGQIGSLSLDGDYSKLQGRWLVLRNEIKEQTTPAMHGRFFIFQEKTFRIDTDKGSEGYSLDETTDPKSIDFNDGRSPAILGIYKLEGDSLVICTGSPGAKRPKEFKTSISSGTVLTELKRAK